MSEEVPFWVEVRDFGGGNGREDEEDIVVALESPGTDWGWERRGRREGKKGEMSSLRCFFPSPFCFDQEPFLRPGRILTSMEFSTDSLPERSWTQQPDESWRDEGTENELLRFRAWSPYKLEFEVGSFGLR